MCDGARPVRAPLARVLAVAALTALTTLGALSACGGKPSAVSWVGHPPRGCAVGSSGPTLNPGHAIRYARRAALSHLAAETLGVEVESELRLGAHGLSEITTQRTAGVLEDSRIAALWSDLDTGGDFVRVREVHALACRNDVWPATLPTPRYPSWVLQVPGEPGRICALGLSGPTRDPRNQEPVALDDAQRALAAALETRIRTTIEDDGRLLATVSTWMETSQRSLERAREASELEERWLDEHADGPLGLRGVLYGLVCVDE